MADQEQNDAKRRAALARFRAMQQETTDPLAMGLVDEIISEIEACTTGMPSSSEKPRH